MEFFWGSFKIPIIHHQYFTALLHMFSVGILRWYINNADMAFSFVADPTLTLNNFIGVMEKVTPDKERRRKVWEEVLEWDGYTPDSYLNEVDTNYSTEKEKTNVLADVYINSRPDSPWEHLVKTLYNAGELAAAREAKSFLQQNGE